MLTSHRGMMVRRGLSEHCMPPNVHWNASKLRVKVALRSHNATEPTNEGVRIKKTLAGLDALLGIQEESKNEVKPPVAGTTGDTAVKPASEDTSLKASTSAPSSTAPSQDGRPTEDQFTKIVEKARKYADQQTQGAQGKDSEAQRQELQQEFQTLLESIAPKAKQVDVVDKQDLKLLKETVFGPMTYWISEVIPLKEVDRTGVVIRGNLRDDREKVFTLVCTKVKELFKDKYEVLMVEDLVDDSEGSQTQTGPRVAFQIVPASQAIPPQTDGLRQGVAFITTVLFIACCAELSLAATITKLPKETLDWLTNPENANADGLPPGLDSWDIPAQISTIVPLFASILSINLIHESGHRIAAAVKNVRLGPAIFIPNLELGTFGAITPFTSLLKNKKDMWDVAAAGPLAGALASIALLLVGLYQSQPGMLPKELLVPVPSALFQGSLLLGGIARIVLGDELLRQPEIFVSPFTVAGWCGALATALNLLPVGRLDGGRLVQASFGSQALSLTSFFTYVGLGLGLLGSALSLPFGLYVVICQRSAEKLIQDSVTPADGSRAAVTAVAVLTAVLVLLPMAPELAEAFGVGYVAPFM